MQKIIFRLYKIYHFIFNEKIYRKLNFFWDDLPSRSILIQKVIEHKKFDSYLEIGCANNENFDKIKIKKKTGVDPNSGGNVKMTSDAFFSKNKLLFDIINSPLILMGSFIVFLSIFFSLITYFTK